MTIQLITVLTLGKALAIKREKGEDEADVTKAHLKFSEMFLRREEINQICGLRPGWAETSFFDELGAPLGLWSLVLHKAEFTVGCIITGPDRRGLKVVGALLSGIELTFTDLGAVMAGEITWLIAGDEASDIEPLLGRECSVAMAISDGGQMDMLKDASPQTVARSLAEVMGKNMSDGIDSVTVTFAGESATVTRSGVTA